MDIKIEKSHWFNIETYNFITIYIFANILLLFFIADLKKEEIYCKIRKNLKFFYDFKEI